MNEVECGVPNPLKRRFISVGGINAITASMEDLRTSTDYLYNIREEMEAADVLTKAATSKMSEDWGNVVRHAAVMRELRLSQGAIQGEPFPSSWQYQRYLGVHESLGSYGVQFTLLRDRIGELRQVAAVAASEYESASRARGVPARMWSALYVRIGSLLAQDTVWAVLRQGGNRLGTVAGNCANDFARRDAVWLDQSAKRVLQFNPVEYLVKEHRVLGDPRLRETGARLAAESFRLESHFVSPKYKDVNYTLEQKALLPSDVSSVQLMVQAFAAQKKGNAGAIQITKYKKDGVPSYIVGIPGTVAMSGAKKHPLDMLSNLDTMYRDDSSGTKYVLAAMKQAGIEPGAHVIFAGHSQGGMIASALGSREDVVGKYKVKGIVTLNSPVAHNKISQGVPALHVENYLDVVTSLDLQAVSTSKDRVQLVGVPRVKDPAERTWDDSHDVEASLNILGLAQTDSAVVDVSRRIEEFLPDRGQVTTARVFDVVKVDGR